MSTRHRGRKFGGTAGRGRSYPGRTAMRTRTPLRHPLNRPPTRRCSGYCGADPRRPSLLLPGLVWIVLARHRAAQSADPKRGSRQRRGRRDPGHEHHDRDEYPNEKLCLRSALYRKRARSHQGFSSLVLMGGHNLTGEPKRPGLVDCGGRGCPRFWGTSVVALKEPTDSISSETTLPGYGQSPARAW